MFPHQGLTTGNFLCSESAESHYEPHKSKLSLRKVSSCEIFSNLHGVTAINIVLCFSAAVSSGRRPVLLTLFSCLVITSSPSNAVNLLQCLPPSSPHPRHWPFKRRIDKINFLLRSNVFCSSELYPKRYSGLNVFITRYIDPIYSVHFSPYRPINIKNINLNI